VDRAPLMAEARGWLELIRLPAVFTAPADVLAGAALTGALASTADTPLTAARLAGAVLASVAVYAAGMAANDYCDARIDAAERPHRPIPSGRVTQAQVLRFVVTLQLLAVLIAGVVSVATGAAALATVGLTWLYNGILKDSPVGPLSMGACRYGNALIGACAVAWPVPPQAWGAPLATLLYVAAVTAVSRFEVGGGRGGAYRTAVAILVALSGIAGLVGALHNAPLWSTLVGLAPTLWLLRAVRPAWPEASGGAVRGIVMAGIFGIALLNAALCAQAGQPLIAALVVALAVSGRFVGRRFYST
jgi:4-hydroxybenzoate polyprenyltransferase